MELVRDFKNTLLKRREIQFVVKSDANPGFGGAKKAIVEWLKAPEEQIVVKFVRNNFGANDFLIEAFVYDSAADKTRTEPKIKLKKKTEGAA